MVMPLTCFILQAKAYSKILANIETATDGSRAWPLDRRQDKAIGVRFDWGQPFDHPVTGERMRNLVLQANRDADNATLKARAAADPHGHIAKITISMKNPPQEEDFLEGVLNRATGEPVSEVTIPKEWGRIVSNALQRPDVLGW